MTKGGIYHQQNLCLFITAMEYYETPIQTHDYKTQGQAFVGWEHEGPKPLYRVNKN